MNMPSTELIKVGELTLEHLRRNPMWSWYDGSLFDDEDRIIPVRAIGRHSQLFIFSVFTTVDGREFEGDVAYDVSSSDVYAIEFWVGAESFSFNKRLPGLATVVLNRLRNYGIGTDNIFPIKFAIATDLLQIRTGEFDLTVTAG